jgi:hypothetical protein
MRVGDCKDDNTQLGELSWANSGFLSNSLHYNTDLELSKINST